VTKVSTINIVVGGLVLVTLAMLALVGIIAVDDNPAAVPEGLWTLLGGSVGALAAMLSRTSSDPNPPPQALEPPDAFYGEHGAIDAALISAVALVAIAVGVLIIAID
jgi:hypothetical protein